MDGRAAQSVRCKSQHPASPRSSPTAVRIKSNPWRIRSGGGFDCVVIQYAQHHPNNDARAYLGRDHRQALHDINRFHRPCTLPIMCISRASKISPWPARLASTAQRCRPRPSLPLARSDRPPNRPSGRGAFPADHRADSPWHLFTRAKSQSLAAKPSPTSYLT